MNERKKNVPLIVALSIPVLMVVLITVSIYVPALFVKPQFDFIYSTNGNSCDDYKYFVREGKLVQAETRNENQNSYCRHNPGPRLFYYDVHRFTYKEISFDEARQYTLDSRRKSPDGFEIVPGNQSFDVLFMSGSSYYDKYLKKGAFSRRINIEGSTIYNFKFLGWVKESAHGEE